MDFHQASFRRMTGDPRSGFVAYELMLLLIAIPVCLYGACLLVNSDMSGKARVAGTTISEHSVLRISLDSDGKRAWFYRRHNEVGLLDLETSEIVKSLHLRRSDLRTIAHSRDGRSSLLCYQDGASSFLHDEDELNLTQPPQRDGIVSALIGQTGEIAISATTSGGIQGWSRRGNNWIPFQYQIPSSAPVSRIFLNPSGTRLCVARVNGNVSFHCPQTGASEGVLLNVGRNCAAFACSQDLHRLAAYTQEGSMQVFDLATNRPAYSEWKPVTNTNGFPTVLEFSPDGRLLAVVVNTAAAINIVEVETGLVAGRLSGHQGVIRTVQFSVDSKRLYSGGLDGTIREWSLDKWTQRRLYLINQYSDDMTSEIPGKFTWEPRPTSAQRSRYCQMT